jgi:hypothetical protein
VIATVAYVVVKVPPIASIAAPMPAHSRVGTYPLVGSAHLLAAGRDGTLPAPDDLQNLVSVAIDRVSQRPRRTTPETLVGGARTVS